MASKIVPDINFDHLSLDDDVIESGNAMDSNESRSLATIYRKRQTSTSKIDDIFEYSDSHNHLRKIYTKGRPPWFDATGKKPTNAFIIGICGGSSSGKTTVATSIVSSMGLPWVNIVSMDSFYNVLTPEQSKRASEDNYNFDVPAALEMDLVVETLKKLKEGNSAEIPSYCFNTHSRLENETKVHYGSDVVIFEGILAFCDDRLKDLMDVKVFVDADADVRLVRRLKRDTELRGRTPQSVLSQYMRFVKPAYEKFVDEFKSSADVIVNNNNNCDYACDVAIQMIVRKIKSKLEERGYDPSETPVEHGIYLPEEVFAATLPTNLLTIEASESWNDTIGKIRKSVEKKKDFVQITNELMKYVITKAVKDEETIVNGNGKCDNLLFERKNFKNDVSMVTYTYPGNSIQPAIATILSNVKKGTMVIKTNNISKNPELYEFDLPKQIQKTNCYLLDPVISSGSALMAIRVLLDHHVPEQNISICGILISDRAAKAIAYAYPHVKIIAMEVDSKQNIDALKPGIYNLFDGKVKF
uniref:Uridine/cytidine kinase n=1 Tax=Rhabditophanes sp. KR3021 TaxID=114890 RepID=A0AC35UDQ4_9BILA